MQNMKVLQVYIIALQCANINRETNYQNQAKGNHSQSKAWSKEDYCSVLSVAEL